MLKLLLKQLKELAKQKLAEQIVKQAEKLLKERTNGK